MTVALQKPNDEQDVNNPDDLFRALDSAMMMLEMGRRRGPLLSLHVVPGGGRLWWRNGCIPISSFHSRRGGGAILLFVHWGQGEEGLRQVTAVRLSRVHPQGAVDHLGF